MALPNKGQPKKKKELLQEIVEPSVKDTWEEKGYFTETEPMVSPEFLQEINEPEHEEVKDESEEEFVERVRRNIRFP